MFPRQQLLALLVALSLAGAVSAQVALKNPTKGTPKIQSLHAIGFGPQGLLLIGDGKGQQLLAIQTGDTTPRAWAKTEIANIKDVLAGVAGAAKGFDIAKLAVNPISQTAYFVVRAANQKEVLLTVDATGKTSVCNLDNVPHVAVKLPAEPKVVRITDVTWAGDRVLLSGQASDTYGSKILSVPAPLASDAAVAYFNAETYHVSHRRWETLPPINTAIPYLENGKMFLVGAYTCTPLVKYALDGQKSGALIKGISVLELGPGNQPQDMFVYEKDRYKYLLVNHRRFHHAQNPVGPSPYWATKIDFTILEEDVAVNDKALWRAKGKASVSLTARAQIAEDYHGVIHMDRLDDKRALVVWTDDKGKFNLRVLPLP